MELKVVKKHEGVKLPFKEIKTDAGYDLYADFDLSFPSSFENDGDIVAKVEPWERLLVPTGLFINIPTGYVGSIRPRSGHSYKTGLLVIEGTIDAHYVGELKIQIWNLSTALRLIESGTRIAQIIFTKVEQVDNFVLVDEHEKTERADGGFGHTGTN